MIRSLLRERALGDALLDRVTGRERGSAAQKPVDTFDRTADRVAVNADPLVDLVQSCQQVCLGSGGRHRGIVCAEVFRFLDGRVACGP
jgi:hypothetical protein